MRAKTSVGEPNLAVFQNCCFLQYIRCHFCVTRVSIFAMSTHTFSQFLVFCNQFVQASSQNLQFLSIFQFHSFGWPFGGRLGDKTWPMGGWLWEPMAPAKEREKVSKGAKQGMIIQRVLVMASLGTDRLADGSVCGRTRTSSN